MSQERDGREPSTVGLDQVSVKETSAADALAEVPIDHMAIFSAPALELVNQWWLESNRRWAARNASKISAA